MAILLTIRLRVLLLADGGLTTWLSMAITSVFICATMIAPAPGEKATRLRPP